MSLREAAQQALEAMDKATRYMSDSDYRKLNDTIDILKTALEQPEPAPVAWQGLTDEEIEDCWDGYLSDYQLQMIRAIEAKLKELNA